jgi:ureidoglycolate lyase
VSSIVLKPQPLTQERFAPYGEVIEASRGAGAAMNDARFDRFDDLCAVDVGDGEVAIRVAHSRAPTVLPYRIEKVERHPLCSQAFVPLESFRMIVVVGPPSESVDPADLQAFMSNGKQGVNYRRGTWHMPLIALETGQRFLVIDRAGEEPNCDEHLLDEAVMLVGD